MENLKFFKYTLLLLGVTLFWNPSAQAQDFEFGGALRFNYVSEFYETDNLPTNNYFTMDTWRINVDGSAADVDLSFEYRFYPTFGTHFIHHGFLGYDLGEDLYMELGVTQVPFGITTYASHSWWFQLPYYVGLEDDYDMGINFDYTGVDNLKLSFAYFRQAEPQGPKFGGDVDFAGPGAGRYSYDIVNNPGNGLSLRELNQFNVRGAYDINENIELGVSAQLGQIYNSVQDESEWSNALAGHLVANYGNLNFKGEVISYDYAAVDDNGNDADIVQMGAYGYNYFGGGSSYTGGVASSATMYVAGLAYTIPVEIGPISSIQPYVDYTFMDKGGDTFTYNGNDFEFYNTQHLVPGMLVTAGNIFTYVDLALGKNQPWLTNSFGKGLGSGVEDPDWNARFNINIGYYF